METAVDDSSSNNNDDWPDDDLAHTVATLTTVTGVMNGWFPNEYLALKVSGTLIPYLISAEALSTLAQHRKDNEAEKEADGTHAVKVSVEWAGSGKILTRSLKLSPTEPIQNLGKLLHKLLPVNDTKYSATKHRVFHGHGGKELTCMSALCGDILQTGDTLVLFPGRCSFLFCRSGSPSN